MEENHSPARIWTFDGGGPSVISQLIIVNEIMHQIQWTLKLNEVPRPCDYAELMVGSGLGAIIVILLARVRLTAEQTLIHIVELGQSVFVEAHEPENHYQFDPKRLRTSISNILRQEGLTDVSRMIEEALSTGQTYATVISTSASNLSHCRLIRTYRTPSAEYNCTIMEAVLAAMAIPSWFPPMKVGPVYSRESLIGGTVGLNNPTKHALDEAKRIFGAESKVSVILSLGSGRRPPQTLEDTGRDKIQRTLDQMAQCGGETAKVLSQRFGNLTFYHRFSVDSGLENISITGWSEDDLGAITSHTKVYLEEIASSLSTAVEVLVRNEGVVTLGQLTQVDMKPSAAKPVPRLSPYFVARNDVYEFMEQRLVKDPWDTQRIFVIYGMGGSGKTQIASFFAKRNKDRYKYVFFIDASSVESIKTDLQSAIRSLGAIHSHDKFDDALRFLAHSDNRDWLVIFDNADDPGISLTNYVPECEHGTLVITGRNPALAELAPTAQWHLQGMNESHCIQVLLRAVKRETLESPDELKAANDLCKLLGGLPLALIQAGCYCHTMMISFLQYLERFNEHRSRLMVIEPPIQLDRYSYSTYTSISLSYSLLDEMARSLLHLLAFFHSASINIDFLRISSKYEWKLDQEWELLPRDNQYIDSMNSLKKLLMPDGSWNDIYIDSFLKRLQSFSLISLFSSNGRTIITLHPLVQSYVLDTLSPEESGSYYNMAILVMSSCSRTEETTLLQLLPAHIAWLDSHKIDIHPNEAAAMAYILFSSGGYEDAKKRWEAVCDECKKKNGEGHRSTLRMSYRIVDCLYRMYRDREAERMIWRIVADQRKVLGEDDDDTVASYHLRARILSKLGAKKTYQAKEIFERILGIYERKYGQEHGRTLEVQSSVILNMLDRRRYSAAEDLSRRQLPVMKKVLGEDDFVTLITLNAFSGALVREGKWEEAEAVIGELITKLQTKFGRHHPETLVCLFNLSTCLTNHGNWEEAERILREIVEVQERIFGKNRNPTFQSRHSLDYVIQQKAARRSLDNVSEETSGKDSSITPETQQVVNDVI